MYPSFEVLYQVLKVLNYIAQGNESSVSCIKVLLMKVLYPVSFFLRSRKFCILCPSSLGPEDSVSCILFFQVMKVLYLSALCPEVFVSVS